MEASSAMPQDVSYREDDVRSSGEETDSRVNNGSAWGDTDETFVEDSDGEADNVIPRGVVEGPSLMWLPDCILLRVLSYLTVTQLVQLGRTNRRLYLLVGDRSLWNNVDLMDTRLKARSLTRLVTTWFPASMHTLKLKGHLNSLRKEFLTPDILALIVLQCPNLKRFHISNTCLACTDYRLFLSLQTLKLSFCQTPSNWLQDISCSSERLSLENLILEEVYLFKNYHLELIVKKSNLKSLHLLSTRLITGVGFQNCVPYLQGLEHLKLTQCCNSNRTLQLIGSCLPNLRFLYLRNLTSLSDEGLKCLGNVKTLQELSLEYCYTFTSKAIIALSTELPAITYFNLHGLAFTTKTLEKLRRAIPFCTINHPYPKPRSVQKKSDLSKFQVSQ